MIPRLTALSEELKANGLIDRFEYTHSPYADGSGVRKTGHVFVLFPRLGGVLASYRAVCSLAAQGDDFKVRMLTRMKRDITSGSSSKAIQVQFISKD